MKVVDALPLMEARLDIAATCVSALAEAHAAMPAGEASKDARPAIKEVVSLRGQVLQCRMIAANAGEFVWAGGSFGSNQWPSQWSASSRIEQQTSFCDQQTNVPCRCCLPRTESDAY